MNAGAAGVGIVAVSTWWSARIHAPMMYSRLSNLSVVAIDWSSINRLCDSDYSNNNKNGVFCVVANRKPNALSKEKREIRCRHIRASLILWFRLIWLRVLSWKGRAYGVASVCAYGVYAYIILNTRTFFFART